MQSNQIRKRFLEFFERRGHAILPSAPLVTTDEKTVTDATLFNTAGMQPLIPYLLGEPHPSGKRLASAQKCVRTVDLEEVGDTTHATFFEMLGNWSLGDYFKEEAIQWSYEFLTTEEGLALDPSRLYITVFSGNDDAPKDEEAYRIWTQYMPESRIYYMDEETNWWSAGANGPCGPDTEMYYDVTGTLGEMSREEFMAADERGDVVEIWNDVFMEYQKADGSVVGKLSQRNVDTGAGLERVAAILQGVTSIYETDIFAPLVRTVSEHAENGDVRSIRIIVDHIRAAAFIIADGIEPSNTDRGYILRRLIRRAIRMAAGINFSWEHVPKLTAAVAETYQEAYREVYDQRERIDTVINEEYERFAKTLQHGLKKFEEYAADGVLSGSDAFTLFSTYGFPIEMTRELAGERGVSIDKQAFEAAMEEHRTQSRTAAAGKFKGGLQDHSEMSVRYHTATHLLHQALREVLGNHVQQRGSNITPDRLRFDFTHHDKMSDEELARVTDMVNEKIAEGLPVFAREVSLEEAKKMGALGVFDEKYEDTVTVYQVGEGSDRFSLEICGGPHVANTSELGHFTIAKESSSAKGVRRIKAVLE